MTAVEQLVDYIENLNKNGYEFHPKFEENLIEQAKEMEKQQKGYSEEEASELVYNIIGEYAKHYGIMIDGSKLNDLFEKFKNKNYERIRI